MGPVKQGDDLYASAAEPSGVAVASVTQEEEMVLLGRVVEDADFSKAGASEIHLVKVSCGCTREQKWQAGGLVAVELILLAFLPSLSSRPSWLSATISCSRTSLLAYALLWSNSCSSTWARYVVIMFTTGILCGFQSCLTKVAPHTIVDMVYLYLTGGEHGQVGWPAGANCLGDGVCGGGLEEADD